MFWKAGWEGAILEILQHLLCSGAEPATYVYPF